MFSKESDLHLYQDTLVKKSKLIRFDRVWKPYPIPNAQIYNTMVSPSLGNMSKGQDTVICLLGLKNCGKTDLLIGKNSDGLIYSALEELINLRQISK